MTTLHFPRPRRYEADGEGTWRLTAGTRVILPEGGAMTRTLARLGEEESIPFWPRRKKSRAARRGPAIWRSVWARRRRRASSSGWARCWS